MYEYDESRIGSALRELARYVKNLTDRIEELEYSVNEAIREINTLHQRVEKLEEDIGTVREGLYSLKQEVGRIQEQVERVNETVIEMGRKLNDRIEKTRKRLEREINETRSTLNKRINEVEDTVHTTRKQLDEHLTKQDIIIETNMEGVINLIAMQTTLALISRYGKEAHMVMTQLRGKPLIVVEGYNTVNIIMIVEKPSKSDLKVLEKLKYNLQEFTGKKVNILISSVKRSIKEGKPVWISSIEGITPT